MFWFATLNGARANTNEHDCVVDARLKIPGESIGTVVSTHEIIRAAFKANETFQRRTRESGVKDYAPTKTVTLKVRPGDGEHVNPEQWQLMGALEAVNGMLLFGLTTAFLFAMIQKVWRWELEGGTGRLRAGFLTVKFR
jgi:hypothetical protein